MDYRLNENFKKKLKELEKKRMFYNYQSTMQEVANRIKEEHEQVIKSFLEITGLTLEDENGNPLPMEELKERFRETGFKIHAFSVQPLEQQFFLSRNNDLVAAMVVSCDFELGFIRRTVIPYSEDLERKFNTLIKAAPIIGKGSI